MLSSMELLCPFGKCAWNKGAEGVGLAILEIERGIVDEGLGS